MDQDKPKRNKQLAAATLIALVLVIAVALAAFPGKKADQLAAETATPSPASASPSPAATIASGAATPTPVAAAPAASGYKNGTYSATGSYDTPESTETVNLTVTLSNGVVTASTVSQKPQDNNSVQYQADFAGGYKAFVIGKNIDSIQLSRVSGSSLTSGGFNIALAAIKAQAKS